MAKTYDPASVPEPGIQLSPGAFIFMIDTLGDDQPTSTHKYQIRGVLRVREPAMFAEQPHFENFVIGTDKDLDAEDPESWKGIAARRFVDMLKKSGITPSGNTDTDFQNAVGQHVGAIIANMTEPATRRDGTPNQYAGTVRANVVRWFVPGEYVPTLFTDGQKAPIAATAGAVAGTPAPAPKVAAAPKAVAPKAVAAPAPQPIAQVVAAQPLTPKAASETVTCAMCQKPVLKSEYVAHVTAHASEEA